MGLSASTITYLLGKLGGGDMTRGLIVVGGIGIAIGIAAEKVYETMKKRITKARN